jgi:serpin B
MISANTKDFQLDIFKEAIKNNLSNNVVLSPISVLFPLSILSGGAKGKTLSEFENLLNDSSNKKVYIENLNEIYNTIKTDSCLKIANAILTKVKVNPSFIQKGQLLNIKFDTLKDEKQVNDWVKSKTEGKIAKIIDKIDPLVKMIVLNALYFHDDWKVQFNKARTKLEPFYLSDSKETKANLMFTHLKNANYIENGHFQAIKLLYNSSKITATIVLPAPNININDFILKIDTKFFFSIFHNTKTEEVMLYLPRIKLENSYGVTNMLKQLGLNDAFNETADFSALCDKEKLYIDSVTQKTYFEMDEKGTTAAAVTAVVMLMKGFSHQKIPKVMRCDRPYLVFLTKYCPKINKTLLLFCAKIENPN